jgi:serine phosphatase RsbU (regulator of sigma subunit)
MSSRREAPPATGRASRLPAPPPLFRPLAPETPEPALLALRRLLLQRWPGRALLGGLALKLLVILIESIAGASAVSGVINTLARIGIIVGGAVVLWWVVQRARVRLLWRVRERLIVSYLFIGVVPALLIAVFALFGIAVLIMSVSAHLFMTGVQGIETEARGIARAAADELERTEGASVQAVLDRYVAREQSHFRGLSLVLVPRRVDGSRQAMIGPASGRRATSLIRAGAWAHATPPDGIPAWVGQDDLKQTMQYGGGDEPIELVARGVAHSRSQEWSIVADVPLDETLWASIEEATGIQMIELTLAPQAGAPSSGGAAGASSFVGQATTATARSMLRRVATRHGTKWVTEPVVFVPVQGWATDGKEGVSARTRVAPGDLFRRLSSTQGQIQGLDMATLFAGGLMVIVLLFLVIEGAALTMGWALARSITGSVHALFYGTERLRLGDLGHRIAIRSRDQLGELAESFNAMTANIETLLEQAAEKRRLEEELRIAREIQMSLLPRHAAPMPGLAMAALCVPAREVGGDYYDFFVLGPRRLGLLVADVAGKGTSAALYMAELKGLMLSLSQIHESPRQLLIEVNRIIAANLDSRSFITMTYAVVDLERRTLTYARAGHTPLIHRTTASPAHAELVAPSGMVVGLQLDGLEHRFAELLEEVTLPLVDGDVFLLYTDGLSEAMNADGDLFSEERLRVLVEEHGGLGADGLRERIVRDVEAHVASADPHDDMTLIVVTVDATSPVGPVALIGQAASA